MMPAAIKVKVIKPACREKGIKFACSRCSCAEYTRRDYKILYENKKLCYFKILVDPPLVLCHTCFCKEMVKCMQALGLEEIDVEVKDGRKKHLLHLYYSDVEDGFNEFLT